MEVIAQRLEDIVDRLGTLAVDWRDETSNRVIDRLTRIPARPFYTTEDLGNLLDENFDDGILIFRLFLGLSKDQFAIELGTLRGKAGSGVKSYRADRKGFVDDLAKLGLLDAMAESVNRQAHWSDVLIERLRSGRGSAISGQRRGRNLEDFAEAIIGRVFGGAGFEARCTFQGPKGDAKCDFAIPSRSSPRIVIESKAYGATGSKMTDIIGDLEQIMRAKRPDTALLFFADGLTWKQRLSDLRKIVDFQNSGGTTRIYTLAMAEQFEADLRQLKSEYKL
jgi:hypothetical protein